ncbi:hypothetical protein U1Q18_006554 [Sarracenia purpurea var. burkii]
MAFSPESSAADENRIDFRAPPPSPIGSGRRSSVTNDDILTDFLEHSLRVPDLILPDRVFPRQNSIQNPPKIDFQRLKSPENVDFTEILDSIARIGCFQLVNHGITREFIRSVLTAGVGIFRLPPEKKAVVSRSPEKSYGFEGEFQGDDEREMSEEFVWCRDRGLKLEMEGIWPLGYSNFSEKIERLMLEIEKVAENFLLILKEHAMRNPTCGIGMTQGQEISGSTCYLYKHCCNIPGDQWVNSLSYDVIRMLVRGSDYSHALCLHLCDGSSEFHVYSKKGWVSFCPDEDAIVITVGDQFQTWSGERYKQVIGKPIFKGKVEEECISMAFLCSISPTNISHSFKTNQGKTISIAQQAIIAILLTLLYHILVYVYKVLKTSKASPSPT